MRKQIPTWVFTLLCHGPRNGPGVLNRRTHFDFIFFLCFSPQLVWLYLYVYLQQCPAEQSEPARGNRKNLPLLMLPPTRAGGALFHR